MVLYCREGHILFFGAHTSFTTLDILGYLMKLLIEMYDFCHATKKYVGN